VPVDLVELDLAVECYRLQSFCFSQPLDQWQVSRLRWTVILPVVVLRERNCGIIDSSQKFLGIGVETQLELWRDVIVLDRAVGIDKSGQGCLCQNFPLNTVYAVPMVPHDVGP